MGGIKRHASPTSPPESPRVAFAPEIVTGISRQLTNDEQWTLYYFEAHAARCRHCVDPLAVSREGSQLCSTGHDLGSEVSMLLFRRRDGHVYSRTRDEDQRQEVRIEMPVGYFQTESLLRAVQRCLHRGEKFLRPRGKIVDDHPAVHARSRSPHSPVQPVRRKKQHRSEDHSSSSSSDERHKTSLPSMRRVNPNVKIVEPTPRPRRTTSPHRTDTTKRGSLYGFDMGELERDMKRERALTYNLQVREPSFGTSGRRHAAVG